MAPPCRGGCDHQALYHAVLAFWRRTHAELQLTTAELALAETRPAHAALARAVNRLVCSTVHFAFRAWARGAARLEGACAATRWERRLREERALVQELEARLGAAEEAEAAARERWAAERREREAERREWEVERREREAERRRWAAEAEEWGRERREQERAAAALLEQGAWAPSSWRPVAEAAAAVEAAGGGLEMRTRGMREALATPETERPLGACAQRLLAAWDTAGQRCE
ncbi:hypothetical protein AB1Y20_008097 [Prymnesium parvum]|uniref:Uncharacterized protein n=1 Tax=Prymnesium parvum TaxID=97485 RepID=A0AB34IW96_PRYPA